MAVEHKPIGDCAEVLPGYSIKSRVAHEPEGDYQVVMARHLKEGESYRYTEVDQLRIKVKNSVKKYLVTNGDLVFISRGTRNIAFLVESVPEPTIASSTLYIIRPKGEVDSQYLAWCINQSPIQAAILQTRTGAGTPIVQRNKFTKITIPVPPLEQQKEIANLSVLMARERLLMQKLMGETERYHRLLGQGILSSM